MLTKFRHKNANRSGCKTFSSNSLTINAAAISNLNTRCCGAHYILRAFIVHPFHFTPRFRSLWKQHRAHTYLPHITARHNYLRLSDWNTSALQQSRFERHTISVRLFFGAYKQVFLQYAIRLIFLQQGGKKLLQHSTWTLDFCWQCCRRLVIID